MRRSAGASHQNQKQEEIINMKKARWISLILSLLMVCALTACGTGNAPSPEEGSAPAPTQTEAPPAEAAPETPAEPEAGTEPGENAEPGESLVDEGQNPIMNFIGSYACDRVSVDVAPDGMGGAKFLVHWGSSAWESASWEMSGELDSSTLVVSYSNCRKSIITFAEDGESSTETVEYENGTGTFTFNGSDFTMTWQDDQENAGEDMVFTFAYAEPEGAEA